MFTRLTGALNGDLLLHQIKGFWDIISARSIKGAKRGGFKRGALPIWTCPSRFVLFLSFLGLSPFLRDFPDLSGDRPGIFLS